MLFRRDEEEAGAPESTAEAKDLARSIRDRAARVRVIPGLLDGSLEELRSSVERVLREYEKVSRRRLGPFQRELEGILKRSEELEEAGKLASRHAKIIRQVMQHARRIHFWNARRALTKIDRILAPAREVQRDLEAYRGFQRKTAQRARDAEETLAKLRAVPKPLVARPDVAAFREVVEACNRAADETWARVTHAPSAEAVKDLVAHPDVEGLGLLAVQEFASLREVYDLFEVDPSLKDSIGSKPLAELVTTSEYSAAKWDRVFPQAVEVRRRLQDLFHQLRPVVGGRYGTAFIPDAPVAMLERRLAAWRRFPGAEANPAWTALAEARASGKIPAIQESARTYERFAELAEKAWDGSLAADIEAQEKELAAARKALSGLPASDALLE